MDKIETYAMRIAAYALAGLSVAACATFGTILAPGWEGLLYGAILAFLDVVKFTLPGRAEFSLAQGGKLRAVICLALFLPLAFMSMASGLGLYKAMISQTSAAPKAEKARYETALRDQKEIAAQLDGLPKELPGVVAARIDALKLKVPFGRSKGCTDATVTESRDLCSTFRDLEAQLVTANRVAQLQGKLEKAKSEAATVNLETIMMPINPQADAIAATLGMIGVSINTDTIPNGLAVVIVLLIELSALVMWLSRDSVKVAPQAVRTNPAPANASKTKAVENSTATPDPLALWLEAKTMRGARRKATAQALLASYNSWAERTDHPSLTGAMLGRKLREAGLVGRKTNGRIAYDGIAIRGDRSAVAAVG